MKPVTCGLLSACIILCLLSISPASAFLKDYFVWDQDANGNAAPAISNALTVAGYTGDVSSTLPDLATLSTYRTVWVCLGMWPSGYAFYEHPVETDRLASYLINYDSTCIYAEGGDAWYLDPWVPFKDYFHLRNWGSNGFSDLVTLHGQAGSFAQGMDFDYSGDNAWVDRLVIDSVSSAHYLFKANDPDTGYGVMVAYDNGNCTYKTIASSCEFAGLVNGVDPSTRVALAESIMSFFCTSKTLLNYDLAAIDIPSPGVLTPPNMNVTPSVMVKNTGVQLADQFYVHMRINPGAYQESLLVGLLLPESTATVSLPDWTAGSVGQQYTVCAWTSWSQDQRQVNDTTCKTVTAWDDRWYIRSPWCYAGSLVAADGDIDPAEWTDAVVRDVSDYLGRGNQQPPGMARLYVMNDSANLYLALDAVFDGSNSDLDTWITIFEDSFDRLWPPFPDSSEGMLRCVNYVPPTGPWFEYQPFFSDSFAVPFWVSVNGWCDNSASGHMQYEYIIPLGDTIIGTDTTGRHHTLRADLGDTVGFWTSAADEGARQIYAWWPTSSQVGFGNLSDMGMIILHSGLERYVELEVVSIVSPPTFVVRDSTYPVTVRIQNNGNMAESGFFVGAVIDTLNPVYSDSAPVANVDPGATFDVTLMPWMVPGTDTSYTMCAYVSVSDSNNANNRTCIEIQTFTGIEEAYHRRRPQVFHLGEVIPNPFSRVGSISFGIPSMSRVTLTIYDVAGSRVRTLADEMMVPGIYSEVWDSKDSNGTPVPAGVYILKMEAGSYVAARKMTVLR